MSMGLIGRKCGMTRIFEESGQSVPVTVVQVDPNILTQIKTEQNDGYTALQITCGKKRRSLLNQAASGHFAKAKVEPGLGLWEFRVDAIEEGLEVGHAFTVEMFNEGDIVDITGVSKGKGFQGPVKRHNFSMQDATHGNSVSHRAHGSTGQNQTPGRVFKGKKMAGRMGNDTVTMQNHKVVQIDQERNLIFIKGALPGCTGGFVRIKNAVKLKEKAK